MATDFLTPEFRAQFQEKIDLIINAANTLEKQHPDIARQIQAELKADESRVMLP